MTKQQQTPSKPPKPVLHVKSGLQAGYWTCSGVSGQPNRKGVIKPAYAAQCWK